jgi:hypothetical protein
MISIRLWLGVTQAKDLLEITADRSGFAAGSLLM